MHVEVISSTKWAEKVIERAYLSCRNTRENFYAARDKKFSKRRYGRYDGPQDRLRNRIHSIFLSRHFGVLEHAIATIQVTGISRSCTHQLVRHRIASYAQLSQRSVSHRDLDIIIPDTISSDPDSLAAFLNSTKVSRTTYDYLRTRKIPKQDARYVLPIGIESQIVITMNFRSWLHFLKLRMDKSAQWEIRAVANKIWEELKELAPNVFDKKYQNLWE